MTSREQYTGSKLYIWNWQGMGYNACRAESHGEALQKAQEVAKGTKLVLLVGSLHEGTQEELNRLDHHWNMD
jgi:hypothetical protein